MILTALTIYLVAGALALSGWSVVVFVRTQRPIARAAGVDRVTWATATLLWWGGAGVVWFGALVIGGGLVGAVGLAVARALGGG